MNWGISAALLTPSFLQMETRNPRTVLDVMPSLTATRGKRRSRGPPQRPRGRGLQCAFTLGIRPGWDHLDCQGDPTQNDGETVTVSHGRRSFVRPAELQLDRALPFSGGIGERTPATDLRAGARLL